MPAGAAASGGLVRRAAGEGAHRGGARYHPRVSRFFFKLLLRFRPSGLAVAEFPPPALCTAVAVAAAAMIPGIGVMAAAPSMVPSISDTEGPPKTAARVTAKSCPPITERLPGYSSTYLK